MKNSLFLVGMAAVAGVVIAVFAFVGADWPVSQPIPFNHRLHLQEVGMECTDCHLYAQTGVRATIPNIEACGGCHAEAVTDSPAEAILVEHVANDTEIPWRKVYWVPEDVYFSHRRHTSLGGVPCAVCHGEVGERELPVTRRSVPIEMDDCMGCHRERGVTTDCISCHR